MDNHMTALVSCFARAHHFMNHDRWIFRDDMAHRLLSREKYGRTSGQWVKRKNSLTFAEISV